MKLSEALAQPVVCGDGAYGTLLAARGFPKQPYDLANLEAPDVVADLHRQYLEAGAILIETNTFTANRFRFVDQRDDLFEINRAGALTAKAACGEEAVVLGAIGPAGKPMHPLGSISPDEVIESASEQARALAEGGVDAFLLESFLDLDELERVIEGVRQVSNLPIIASKAFIEDGEAISGGLPYQCAKRMAEMDVVAVGANCVVGPQRMLDLVRMMTEATSKPVLAYPTPGMPTLIKGRVAYDTDPTYFAKACRRLAEEGATLIGGCCGTTPDHIRALSVELGRNPVQKAKRASVAERGYEAKPLESTPPTEFGERIAQGESTFSVELDVPRGLKLDRLMADVEAVRAAGAHTINISDGARARLRMNPTAVCHLIQSTTGAETTMHFSCRDRNLLAIQADLLGCHALGVRNVLAITGDPANIGDYPSATSVFDVDAVGLVRILGRLNEGIDLAGYGIGRKCGFTICVAFNPGSPRPDVELARLQQKADAGAHAVYTQPVFDESLVQVALESCERVGLPCLIGVMPLRNARHAEFMHNEVPGILVPERLRTALAEAPDDDAALELGIEQALGLARLAKSGGAGVYLMPPANRIAAAVRVLEGIR